MRKKNLIKWFLALTCLIAAAGSKAQGLDSIIKAAYPPSVVERVYAITAATPVPAFKQKMFADFFVRQDSIMANLIELKTPDGQIDSVKKIFDSTFESIFAAKEKFDYFSNEKKNNPIPYSQFSMAVKYKTALGLSDGVVNTLLEEIQKLREMKTAFYKENEGRLFDPRAYESETMGNILTDSQYVKLLIIKNKSKVKTYALQDWRELQVRGMAAGHNRDSTLTELADFYLKRQVILERYAHDKLKQSDNIKYLYENKPAALNALLHARRNPDNDTQGQAFQW